MDEVRVTTIAIVFAIALLGLRHRSGVLNNFSDFFFSLGTVLIVVGGTRYIRNVGLFKTFSYMAYKKRWRHGKCGDGEMRPMSMAEYTQNVVMDEMRAEAGDIFSGRWCGRLYSGISSGFCPLEGALLLSVIGR